MMAVQLDCPGYMYDLVRRAIHRPVERWSMDRRIVAAVVSLWLALFVRFAAQAAPPPADEPTTLAAARKVLDLREFPLLPGAKGAAIRNLGTLFYETPGEIKQAYALLKAELEKRKFKEQPGGYHSADSASGSFLSQGYSVAASVSGGSQPGRVQVAVINHGNIDLAKLPTPKDVKPFYARAGECSYLAKGDVSTTTAACQQLVQAAGWTPYGAASDDPESPMMYFKRGVVRVMCWVSTAPAQQNQTLIRYSSELLSADIPAPPQAGDLRFDESSSKLTFAVSNDEVAPVFEFYRTELAKQSWQPTTGEPIDDDQKRTSFLVFRNPDKDMISIDVRVYNEVADVSAKFTTEAELKRLDEIAAEEAARAKAEMAEKNKEVTVALTLPEGAAQAKREGEEFKFTLPAGSSRAALKQLSEELKQAGWTTKDDVPDDDTLGWMTLKNGHASIRLSYWDSSTSGAEITLKLSDNVALQTQVAGDQPSQVAAKKPAKNRGTKKRSLADIPGVPKLPDGIVLPDMPAEIGELLNDLDAGEDAANSAKKEAGGNLAKVAELPIPAIASGVEYKRIVKMIEATSDAALSEFGQAFLDALTEQGWETAQRPLLGDDSCIIKLRRGGSDLTIMGNGSDEGSQVTLMCKALDWSVVPPSRVAAKRPASARKAMARKSQDSADEEPTSDDSPATQDPPARQRLVARVVPQAEQKLAAASLWVGAKQHKLGYGVAYEIDRDGSTGLEVLLAVKPVSGDKLAALINAGKDGGDAAGFDPHLKLRFNDKGQLEYLFFYADGLSINRGGLSEDVVQAEITLADGRARGKAVMEKPEKIFDDEFRFDAAIDVPLATVAAGAAGADVPPTDELGAEEHDGFPYPLLTANRSSVGTRYRKTIELTVPAALDMVVAFYRRELKQRGWQEDAAAATLGADAAALAFSGPEGTIAAKLTKQGDDVAVVLDIANAARARADGMAPKANHGRIILGNASDREATMTINGQQYKLRAGLGAEDPKQGQSLDVLPGKYTFVFKRPGQSDQTETIVVAVGETWGAIVGPSGVAIVDRLY